MNIIIRIVSFLSILSLMQSCSIPDEEWGVFYNDSDTEINVRFYHYYSSPEWAIMGGKWSGPQDHESLTYPATDVHHAKFYPLKFEVRKEIDETVIATLILSYDEYKAKGFKLHYPADFPSGEDEGESADEPTEETE